MAVYIDNAISWAGIKNRGGWKMLAVSGTIYSIIIVGVITLFYQLALTAREKAEVLSGACTVVMVIQGVMLLLLGGLSAANLIRRDITSRQMESNRLMPLSASQAVVGYIAGAEFHALALGVVNVLIGAVLTGKAGQSINDWLICNVLLLGFCICIWSTASFAAFYPQIAQVLMIMGWSAIGFSTGLIAIVIPGLLPLTTPLQGKTIFQPTTLSRLTNGTIAGAVAQVLFTVIFIRAAARRYADATAQGLPLGPSMLILALWSGLTWFGISDFYNVRPQHLGNATIDWRVIVVGGLASCLLAAVLPVSAIAWSQTQRQWRRRAGARLPGRAWVFWACLPILLLFAAVPLSAKLSEGVVSSFIFGAGAPAGESRKVLSYGTNPNPGMILCAGAIFLIQSYFLLRLLYLRPRLANFTFVLLVGLCWVVPLITDLIYYAMQPGNQTPAMNHFALFSPIGTMIQGLDNPVRLTWRGVLGQGAIAAVPVIIFLLRYGSAGDTAAEAKEAASGFVPGMDPQSS